MSASLEPRKDVLHLVTRRLPAEIDPWHPQPLYLTGRDLEPRAYLRCREQRVPRELAECGDWHPSRLAFHDILRATRGLHQCLIITYGHGAQKPQSRHRAADCESAALVEALLVLDVPKRF